MAAHDILWYYAGSGVIPQGYPAVDREVRMPLEGLMDDMGEDYFTYEVRANLTLMKAIQL